MSLRPLLSTELDVLKTALGFLGGVATFAIPVPVWLIVAIVAGWQLMAWWDTSAAVKAAVEKRVTEMITGAEKQALEAQLEETEVFAQKQTELLLEAQRRAAVIQLANANLQADIAREEEKAEDVQARYDEWLKNPLKECVVGGQRQRLRNN